MEFADAPLLTTPRLRLRGWRADDLAPFARLNADPRVVEFLPHALSTAESDAFADRIQDGFRQHGFGLWAVEVVESHAFAGVVGLNRPAFVAPFMPAVEIGWRLAPEQWGHGYATEAASAAVQFAFVSLALSSLVSFTVPANVRSRAVMERLEMTHDAADDFDHPRLAEGDRLRRHVLYRLPAPPG